jgi:hypothetical protein
MWKCAADTYGFNRPEYEKLDNRAGIGRFLSAKPILAAVPLLIIK